MTDDVVGACRALVTRGLSLAISTELPDAAQQSVRELGEAGLRLSAVSVYVAEGSETWQLVTLNPPPVRWDRRLLSPLAARVAGRDGAVERGDEIHSEGETSVVSIAIAVGDAAVVELACEPGSTADGATLRDCATGFAVLVHRAADLREMEAARGQLAQLDDELIALHDGSLSLSGADEREVAGNVVKLATTELGFDRAGVFYIDRGAAVLRGVAGVDELRQIVSIASTAFPLNPADESDLTELAQVARGELPYFLTQDLDGEGRKSIEGNIQSNAQVPMRVSDRIVGVLVVDNYFSGRSIVHEQLPGLMILANHAGATMANTRLQRDLQDASDNLESLVQARTAELAATNERLGHAIQSGRDARAAELRTQTRLLHLLASGPAVIYSCSLESGFPPTFISANVMGLSGYSADKLIGEPSLWTSRIHPDDRKTLDARSVELIDRGELSAEYRVRHRDGTWRWILDEMRVVQSRNEEDRAQLIGSWLEVTARRSAESERAEAVEELTRQRALAMRSDRLRSLGEMAAGIAHELNQPLAGVRGIAEHLLLGLQRQWDLSPEKISERAQRIIDQADRMIHIIDHVRVFAREAGRPEMTEVDVNDVVRAATDMHDVQFRTQGLELRLELQQELPTTRCNAYSLEEVVHNLLANARDATVERMTAKDGHEGRITVRTSMLNSGRIRVEVADNGVGITESELERVFEPFHTTKGPDKGTGLGLSISRSIVEQFSGRLYIESSPGNGSSAVVLLTPIGIG